MKAKKIKVGTKVEVGEMPMKGKKAMPFMPKKGKRKGK